ncbi:ABC transporter permease [Phytoactinopolyspora halotolerans]|uniref:ABC transporter permease n=1 Tax=Phytoactinopolyspora halotolerans TaxID=1981512 RepID=A0A6L9SB93_9ACTN|nr:ABC transporter permease [Phytoactinopolyspora halotolerans]NEE01270.1 ABC transporter permease [Phytoactinopolyspora halotolerans]
MSVRHALRTVVLALTLPVVLVAAWWFATADSTSFYFPPLAEIVETFQPTWLEDPVASSRIVTEALPSLGRLTVGYLLALVAGVALGVAIGSSAKLRAFTEPVLEFFRAVPPPVLIPILMLFAGIGTQMKILVIMWGCIWPILLNTVEGVRGLDEVLRDTARCYRMRRTSMLFHMIIRGASPQIVTGARQALSIAIILMVISEMFAANNGLGFTIVQFQRSFAIPEMWSGIILLGLLGVALSLIFRAVEWPVLAWYRGYRQAQRGGN